MKEFPMTPPHVNSSLSSFQLCFRSLSHSGRDFAFPCDAKGQVSLDHMSERARNNYFYARAMVGRELTPPAVAIHCIGASGISWVGELKKDVERLTC
jgi:hypothetical protein